MKSNLPDSMFLGNSEREQIFYSEERIYYTVYWQTGIPRFPAIIKQLDDNTAVVEITRQFVFDSLKHHARIAVANNNWKFSPGVALSKNKNDEEQQFILSSKNLAGLITEINKLTPRVSILLTDEASGSVVIQTTAVILNSKIAGLNEVVFIDRRVTAQAEISIIGYNRSFHGLSAVDYSIPGATGKNIVVGVKEQKMEEADLDLHKRVLSSSLAASNTTNHATVVSSIIGGAGNSFYDGRGIANGCKFFPSSFSNLFPDDAAVLNTNKVSVQNHSYGTVIQQFYGAEAVSYDAQIWANKNLLHVFSSGNQGTASATNGPYANINGYANLTANFKMAKNIITVGAIDNKGNIPAESSAGPIYDGRVAPQLIALGPNGTSDAAAVVSGTIAVMQQVYADSNSGALPAASLIKAVLYNRTDDIFRTGIDYKTGYGLLNSLESVRSIQQKEYDGSVVTQGQQWIKNIYVPANAAQLKVTLAWTDSAAPVNNLKALINDLDLEVTEPGSNTIYKPWVLNSSPHIDSLTKLPVRKRDSLNTAEQVSIQLPAAGNYEIKIKGTTVSSAIQPFHISWHIDTLNTFHFISPSHTSDVNRSENPLLDIKWKTHVADTNTTGNLSVSYDNGNSWQLIKLSHKIYTNQHQWQIKDTVSRALLKMETPFGSFFSNSFVISPVLRPQVDFLCTDSFGLSWNKLIYASGFKIYTLTDSPYLKHISTTTDTMVVINRLQYPNLVYAVEPILNNGLPAARSIALDVTAQAVKCFYKTFFGTLLDGNKLELKLQLGTSVYTDSAFFELVTQSGQIIQTAGGLKIISGVLDYTFLVSEVQAGTSYWRVRLKQKNNSILYTEIISILSSGKKYILFYPNPAERNSPLIYVLQQGVPFDSRLEFFDISGQLLRLYNELPGSIDISKFPAGIIIYKLLSNAGKVLESRKLLIR